MPKIKYTSAYGKMINVRGGVSILNVIHHELSDYAELKVKFEDVLVGDYFYINENDLYLKISPRKAFVISGLLRTSKHKFDKDAVCTVVASELTVSSNHSID